MDTNTIKKEYRVIRIEEVDYEGEIYDLSVKDTQSYNVSTNGNTFIISHNSGFPDIDADFGVLDRLKVKEFLHERFKSEYVCDIGTVSTYQLKAIVRDFLRIFKIDDKKLLAEMSLLEDLATVDEFTYLKENQPEIFKYVKKILGNRRHISKHAAGVIISSKKIGDYIPIIYTANGMVTGFIEGTARSMVPELSSLGFLKFDILGLNNLSIIKECLSYSSLTLDHLDIMNHLNDKKVLNEFANGNTVGVFQFESTNMKSILKRLKVDDIEDLIATCALYRPGPIEAGMIDDYIDRKHSGYQDDSIVGQVLKDTYGQIIYQEQIMKLSQEVSGYSLAEADELRKMISKYKTTDKFVMPEFVAIIQKNEKRFLDGCKKTIGVEEGRILWEKMAEFAKYSFNRAHSAAYAITGYLTMYLKVYYPLEYMTALLNNMDDEKVPTLVRESERLGIKVLPIDINKSGVSYTVDKEQNAILCGLVMAKGIGQKAAEKIIVNRPYENIENLEKKCGKGITKNLKAYYSTGVEVDTLNELYVKVHECSACKNVCEPKCGWSGNINSPIMIIAQSPKLDKNGKYNAPFGLDTPRGYIGSGEFLKKFLDSVKLNYKKDDFYITNIIKCPVDKLIDGNDKNCSKFLKKEIELIRPKLIVALGKIPSQYFGLSFGDKVEFENYTVISNFHPAFISRDRTREETFFKNFEQYKHLFQNAKIAN